MAHYSKLKFFTILAILIIGIPTIMALGVSSPYWKDNPLKMAPGQVKEISFSLTNSPTEETEKASISLLEGKEITEIISGLNYTVSPGSTDTKVILKISIPSSAKIGNSYNITLFIKSSPTKEEGTVKLSIGYKASFPVLIVESSESTQDVKAPAAEIEKKKSSVFLILIPSFIIIIAIIIVIFVLKRKKVSLNNENLNNNIN